MKRKIRVKLGQAILLRCHQRFPHINQKHLRLRRRPSQPIPKRPPREPDQPLHADIAQDVPALLQPPLARPRPVGAFFLLVPDVDEAGGVDLLGHVAHAEEVRAAEGGEPAAEVVEEVAPGKGPVAGCVIAGGNVFEFLNLDVAAWLQVSFFTRSFSKLRCLI